MPAQKEIHFFDYRYDLGLNWYRGCFPIKLFDGKITGEASPYYLFHPHVPARVKRDCPDTRMIVLLRNPVDRAYSHYMMEYGRKTDTTPSFEEAISSEEERVSSDYQKMLEDESYFSYNHQHYTYLARGRYHEQVTRWLRLFPMKQFLFLKSEDFFSDPWAALKEVYRFLELPEIIPVDLTPDNTNEYLPMREETREWLKNYYFDENKRLQALLGERFMW